MAEHNIIFLGGDHSFRTEFWNKISAGGLTSIRVNSLEGASELLVTARPLVCICLEETASDTSLRLLDFIHMKNLGTKVIVHVNEGSVDDAVSRIKAGADDFLIHDPHGARLIESIMRSVTNFRQIRPDRVVAGMARDQYGESVLIGQSPALCEIRSAVSMIAKSESTALITGESGTGKEVVARLIHMQSPRNRFPYITINCAAIPKDIIENELFGHEKGAFTGALAHKAGCFEQADGGTLLFDEIAEMSLDTQAKLLRAIEIQKFRRLGGKEEISVDVRIVAATNRNVPQALRNGELRTDLYYRLGVVELNLPPVRERQEDIPLLIDHFFSQFSGRYEKPKQSFSDEALEILMAYEWPGNVREVRNVVERATVICPHESIEPQYLPHRITTQDATRSYIKIPIGSTSRETEKILILETLASAGYNKAKAAKILGVSRKTLHNKLTEFQKQILHGGVKNITR